MVALLAACSSSSSSSSTSPSASATSTDDDGHLDAGRPGGHHHRPVAQGHAAERDLKRHVLRVASDIPYPPWEYNVSPASKQLTGFDYDLAQAIGKKIGIPVSFNETLFASIISALKGGRRDMAMSDMYDNAQRESQGVDFVDYAYDTTSMLVPKGNPKGITNLDSLAGQTVCCESGTTQQAWLEILNAQFKAAGKKAMTILARPNQLAALAAIASGGAVADLTDHSTAVYIARTTNSGNSFEVVVDPAAPNGYRPTVVGIAIPASDTALVTTVQKALQDLINDGNYLKIVNSYGLTPVTSAQINLATKASPAASPSS